MFAKSVLDSAHLPGELTRRAVGKLLEIPIEVGLIRIPEFVRQIGSR
jgi:hypothetical protein